MKIPINLHTFLQIFWLYRPPLTPRKFQSLLWRSIILYFLDCTIKWWCCGPVWVWLYMANNDKEILLVEALFNRTSCKISVDEVMWSDKKVWIMNEINYKSKLLCIENRMIPSTIWNKWARLTYCFQFCVTDLIVQLWSNCCWLLWGNAFTQ